MINKKKEAAKEIAFMFLFKDISNCQQLSNTIKELYKRYNLLFITGKPRSEYPFIYIASKYIHGIPLAEFDPFLEFSVSDHAYRKAREADESLLNKVGKNRIEIATRLMRINLNYYDLNLISDEESIEFYRHLISSLYVYYPLLSMLKSYASNKVFEGILDGDIKNRYEKEVLKKKICDLYGICIPSDEEICLEVLPRNSHIDFSRENLERILKVDLSSLIKTVNKNKWGNFLKERLSTCYKALEVVGDVCKYGEKSVYEVAREISRKELPTNAILALYTFGFLNIHHRDGDLIDLETIKNCLSEYPDFEPRNNVLVYLSKDGEDALKNYVEFKSLTKWRMKTGNSWQV